MARDKDKAKAVDEAEDHIAAFEAQMAKLVGIAENAEFESGTLLGGIRDPLIEIIKHRPKAWSQMSESEQRDQVKTIEQIARTFIRRVVLVVAEQEEISVTATLKGYSADGEVFKLKLEARGDEDTALQLFRMDGHEVVVMSADAARFLGQKKDADVQLDQPALELDVDEGEGGGEEVDLAEAGNAPAVGEADGVEKTAIEAPADGTETELAAED